MSVSLSGEQKGDINVRKPYFLSYLFPAAAVVTSELGHHDIMCTVCLVFNVKTQNSKEERMPRFEERRERVNGYCPLHPLLLIKEGRRSLTLIEWDFVSNQRKWRISTSLQDLTFKGKDSLVDERREPDALRRSNDMTKQNTHNRKQSLSWNIIFWVCHKLESEQNWREEWNLLSPRLAFQSILDILSCLERLLQVFLVRLHLMSCVSSFCPLVVPSSSCSWKSCVSRVTETGLKYCKSPSPSLVVVIVVLGNSLKHTQPRKTRNVL